MDVRGMLVEGVKIKFACEVYETQMLDSVQKIIIQYFDAIGSSLKNEFDKAKSLNFQIRSESSSFLEIEIGNTGLEFIRKSSSILVKEILENGGVRDYDRIYVRNKAVVTDLYSETTFTSVVLDKYVQYILFS